jgi:flagellar protein FliS
MQNPYDKYRSNAVFTATKEELVLMLYDGAVRFCNQALAALENKDINKTHNLIIRVQDIIREFQIALDTQYEISAQLDGAYDYLHGRLVDANLNKDAAILAEVRDHLRQFRDTWREAMKLSRQQSMATVAR